MTPTLIGYFPKRTLRNPDWLHGLGVDEVCSVSTCMSKGPDEWIDYWRHNELFVFNSPELAWSVVPEADRSDFEIYAYKLFPVIFIKGQEHSFDIPALVVDPMPANDQWLGFDVVSRSCGSTFECSPLSCNRMAERHPVNRYCLVDDVRAAFQMAAEFEALQCEPGPYHVVEVWRQGRV